MSSKRNAVAAGSAPPAKRAALAGGVPLTVGVNCFGQLGVGEHITERKKPALLTAKGSLTGVRAVHAAAGGMHTAIVDDTGRVHTFGCNDEGALGRPTVNDGEYDPAVASGLKDVKVVMASAGDSHTAVLDVNGTVHACGCFRDDDGALAFSPSVLIQRTFVPVFPTPAVLASVPASEREGFCATAIASGVDHIVILTNTGHVYTMGTGKQGQLGRINQRKTERGSHRVARGQTTPEEIQAKRTTVSFLESILLPQRVKARGLSKVKSISAGAWGTMAVDVKGDVWAWGLNNYHQLGVPRPDAETATAEANCVFVPKRAVRWDGLGVQECALGQHHAIARTAAHQVYTLGRGDCGRLGDGANVDRHEPVHVAALKDHQIVAIGGGSSVSYAITSTGKAYAWGFGENLQLTNGEEKDALLPLLVEGKQVDDRKIVFAQGGGQHAVFIAQ